MQRTPQILGFIVLKVANWQTFWILCYNVFVWISTRICWCSFACKFNTGKFLQQSQLQYGRLALVWI